MKHISTDFDDKRRRRKSMWPMKRAYVSRMFHSRFRGIFLLILISAMYYAKFHLFQPNKQTLILDNERHLFIRLFKQNDPTRKNVRPFRILSGSLHYFRVLPQLWSERIQQMKAAGLNTIETYVPWNIHEPEIGKYQFDNLIKFLKLVHQHEMFTIIRPSGKKKHLVFNREAHV
jgi:hypothetical protein